MKKGGATERKQAWVRLLVTIVLSLVAYFWGLLAGILIVLGWLYAVILGSRNRFMAEFVELYGVFLYDALRYSSGHTNEKPFPFAPVRPMSKFEVKWV